MSTAINLCSSTILHRRLRFGIGFGDGFATIAARITSASTTSIALRNHNVRRDSPAAAARRGKPDNRRSYHADAGWCIGAGIAGGRKVSGKPNEAPSPQSTTDTPATRRYRQK